MAATHAIDKILHSYCQYTVRYCHMEWQCICCSNTMKSSESIPSRSIIHRMHSMCLVLMHSPFRTFCNTFWLIWWSKWCASIQKDIKQKPHRTWKITVSAFTAPSSWKFYSIECHQSGENTVDVMPWINSCDERNMRNKMVQPAPNLIIRSSSSLLFQWIRTCRTWVSSTQCAGLRVSWNMISRSVRTRIFEARIDD